MDLKAKPLGSATPVVPSRWVVLALLSVAQLMVTLDATIVNIALPSAQNDLGFSDGSRQWIITAYALAFGSLLLLGGKLGDLFGRKWTFTGGLLGFAAASAIGGLAPSFGVLVGARALQGLFGALLAPSALALLTVTFDGSPDRNTAFGIFGAIAGGGASIGLLLGGVLTDSLSWRWCLYVNLVIAVPVALVSLRVLADKAQAVRPRVDLPGALVVSAGLFALVYGFSRAESDAWTAPLTIAALAAGVGLLAAFVLVEQRSSHPLLPLRVVTDRGRGGAFASMGLASMGLFAVFLFLTYYLQQNLGFSPLRTGVAFLPLAAMIIVSSGVVQTLLVDRLGARLLVSVGMALGCAAMLLLTRLDPASTYAGGVLPGLLVMGVGLGFIFGPALATATRGIDGAEAGVASAMVNTSQQVGGSIGTALLSTLFAGAVTSYGTSHARNAGLADAASIHGYTVAFWWAAGIFAVGLLVALGVLPPRPATHAGRSSGAPVVAAVVIPEPAITGSRS